MKKILAMSLAILIAFTLSACGGITITPADNGSGTQEETATPAVPTDTPVPDKVQNETPDPVPQDEVPSGTIKPAQASASDTDGTKTPGKTNTVSPSAGATTGQKNALQKAHSYLSFSAFSYNGLVDQLEYEGFTHEEAVYGADNCGADWDAQAVEKAKSYLKFSSFSHDGLIDQLEYEGFTHDQAVYGADNCGLEGGSQAVAKAKSYLDFSAFSYDGLVEQLEYEGFSHEDAVNAADNCGADWNEQAAKKAKSYLDLSSFSRNGLIDQLEYEGFTHDQAVYGVEANGL